LLVLSVLGSAAVDCGKALMKGMANRRNWSEYFILKIVIPAKKKK
jgi:hypothetical protein